MGKVYTTSEDLTSVANAIRAKSNTNNSLVYPTGFVTAIQNIPSGSGGGNSEGDVIFIDYDGNIVDAKSKAEINAMTSDSDLPANPTHTGLTAQGWNWTVAQLKAQLTAIPNQKVYVGQMYVTSSGKTEIDVEMQDGRLSPIMSIAVDGTIEIDWGDNTTPDTVTGTSESTRLAVGPHNYASAGNYTITISVISGSFRFYNSISNHLLHKNSSQIENKVYANCIKKIRIGTGISHIGNYAFYYCNSLTSVTIPSSITSVESYAFSYCYCLESITIPSGITDMGSNVFSQCYALVNLSLPSSITSIGSGTFYACYSLTDITIPSNVTNIGTQAFSNCYSITNLTIPSSVTSMGSSVFYNCYSLTHLIISSNVISIENSTFNYCHSLKNITIPNNVTSIGSSAFNSCYSLASITIPSKVTSIEGSAFRGCSSLNSVTIPNNVTSIKSYAFYRCYSLTIITIPNGVISIEDYAFDSCYSLASLTIPSSVTSIGTAAFQSCYGVAEYHILSTSVPTAGTDIFKNIAADCVIYVPRGKLTDYQTATNWSTYSSYMQEEPAT